MQLPAIILKGDDDYQIVRYITAFYYGSGNDAILHPAGAWTLWSPTDWQEMCPNWTVVPLIENPVPGPDETAQINPFNEWLIFADRVEVTYTYVPLGAEEQLVRDEDLLRSIKRALQQHLDQFAQQRDYTNMLSACTYATSTIPKYRMEGQACVEQRDAVYLCAFELLAEVQAGTRPRMTPEEVLAALPPLTWPSE